MVIGMGPGTVMGGMIGGVTGGGRYFALIKSDAFSAIIIVGAFRLPETTCGILKWNKLISLDV